MLQYVGNRLAMAGAASIARLIYMHNSNYIVENL